MDNTSRFLWTCYSQANFLRETICWQFGSSFSSLWENKATCGTETRYLIGGSWHMTPYMRVPEKEALWNDEALSLSPPPWPHGVICPCTQATGAKTVTDGAPCDEGCWVCLCCLSEWVNTQSTLVCWTRSQHPVQTGSRYKLLFTISNSVSHKEPYKNSAWPHGAGLVFMINSYKDMEPRCPPFGLYEKVMQILCRH